MSAEELLASDFAALPDLIRAHGSERPRHLALIEGDTELDYAGLAALMDRIVFALQRDGVRGGDAVAICARNSIAYAAAFCGILAAGAAVALLAPSSTPASLMMMLEDSGAKVFLLDGETGRALKESGHEPQVRRVALDDGEAGEAFSQWIGPDGAKPTDVSILPDQTFDIIYSSGTTGAPKGIVQPHRMRWTQFTRVSYSDAVTIVSTPLYSNTTLVVFIPTLAHGGTAVLMAKFDAGQFLRISQERRVTHAMLVPVQYRRIMEPSGFRPIRSLELRPEALDQRAVPRRAEGRCAEAMARGPCRVLRDDRRRRVDDAPRPSVSAQAAHRRPADAGT